jgi:hypothetical protein
VVWLALGCRGDGEDVVAVSGQVTVNGQPLRAKNSVINFVPDRERGNTTTLQPTGYTDEDGHYTLYYAPGKKGAPPGWYRVQVAPNPGDRRVSMPRRGQRTTEKALFAPRDTRAETSGLVVEVVRSPELGAYDLQLRE